MLEKTKYILNKKLNLDKPEEEIINILKSVLELLSLPDNDFAHSGWQDQNNAVREITDLLKKIQSGELVERKDVNVLFAPTGAIQEVSIGSGWSEAFLKLASIFDEIEKAYWR